MSTALPMLGLLVLVPLLLWLRQNMIVVLGCGSAWLYYFYSNGALANTALDAWQNARNETFLAIPLYGLALIDIGSAILILSPLLAPMAKSMGMDPVHFGMIMLVNLEIGYLTPPMGLNLIVASMAFKASLVDCCRAVVPFIGILLLGLRVVVLRPGLSLALVK